MLLCSSSELFSSRSSVVMLLLSSVWLPIEFLLYCSRRLRGFRCTDCSLSYECQCKISEFSVIHDSLYATTNPNDYGAYKQTYFENRKGTPRQSRGNPKVTPRGTLRQPRGNSKAIPRESPGNPEGTPWQPRLESST